MNSSSPDNHTASEYSTPRMGFAVLEAIAGTAAALKIMAACAGRELLFRAIPLPDDELAQLIGLGAATSIADALFRDSDEGGRHFLIDQPPEVINDPAQDIVLLDDQPTRMPTLSEKHAARAKYSTGIAALEAIAGRDAALVIICACAGREIFVRAVPLPDDELSRLVGIETAQAIADELLDDTDVDAGGRDFFINQPALLALVPGETLARDFEPIAAPRDAALKGHVGFIEEVCGRDAALKIVAHYGGRRLYIPQPERLTANSALAKIIGLEAAEALCAAFQGAGEDINISPSVYGSSAVRRDIGMKMLREGYSPADVTRTLKVARSVAFDWARKIKEERK